MGLKRILVAIAVATGTLISAVVAFPSGGPVVVCADPYPHHSHVVAQSTESPFIITLDPPSYGPGDSIRVSIRTKTSSSPASFTGYQLAAHPVLGRWDDLQGNFTTIPESAVKHRFYSNDVNCVTHGSKAANQAVNFTWRAPDVPAGNIVFSATVLVDFDTFWVNVSAVLSANEEMISSAVLAPRQEVFVPSRISSMSNCGKEVGCLLWPRYCSDFFNCDYAVTYQVVDNDNIKFQLAGKSPGFLSLGFSSDKKMDGDETLSCLSADGRLSFQHGYNPAYYNARVTEDSVSQISIRQEDGFLFCEFLRPVAVNVTALGGGHSKGMESHLFDLRHPTYHVYLGWGGVYPGSYDSMMKHDELPLVSDEAIDFFKQRTNFFNAIPMEIQVHATLMLAAWMVCASIAATIARYSRSNLFGRTKLCGQIAWFQVHRSLLFMTAALTIASFVIVFVFIGGWTKVAIIHASFGIAACALMIIQVLAGLCRPGTMSSRRRAFAWFHRIGGTAAWLCAAVSCVLGTNVVYFPSRITDWGTAVLVVWIGFQLIVAIIFEILQCIASRSEVMVVQLQEASMVDRRMSSKRTDDTAAVKTFLLIFYICCMVALLIAALAMLWFY